MSEKEKTLTRYLLRVTAQTPNAMSDDYDGGYVENFDAITFEILEGGSGELTVFFSSGDDNLFNRFANGATFEARSSLNNLTQLDVVFSGALEFSAVSEPPER